jgi:hypothetical protein
MNLVELDRALRQLRLSGMAAVLETRLRQAQTEKVTPIDLVSMLVSDELLRRQDRLLERRHKLARFRRAAPSRDARTHVLLYPVRQLPTRSAGARRGR